MISYHKKLALGTAQFGLDYGISNISGKIEENEVAKILETAWRSGVDTIDTARGYGNSEKVLGLQLKYPFRIVTKFPGKANTQKKIEQAFSDSLKALHTNSVYGFLAHDANLLIKEPQLGEVLLNLKQNKLVEKIGYSLYTPEQLEQLIDLRKIPDIVQLPYSFLDQRFKYFFARLKLMGTEIHVRSVFLQGLFFMNPDKLSPYFESVKPILKNLQLSLHNIDDLAAWLIQFVLKERSIDKVIFGVNNLHQLEFNLLNLQREYLIQAPIFNHKIPEKVLMPHSWPKKIEC